MNEELKIQIEPWESDSDTCVLRLNRVVATSPEYFSTAEEAADSPLGKKLVAIQGLEAVLMQDKVITLLKPVDGFRALEVDVFGHFDTSAYVVPSQHKSRMGRS